jgi:hypothetical protein
MNAGIQGLAADIFKVALVRLDAALERRARQPAHPPGARRGHLEVPPGERDAVGRRSSSTPCAARRPAGAARGQPRLRRHLGRRQGLSHDRCRRLDHWFEPVADHLGAAYLRYSFTKGTEQEVSFLVVGAGTSSPGCGCSTSAAGPGRHAHALAERGIEVHGIDISGRFVELAGVGPAGRDVRAARRPVPAARSLRRRVRRRHLPVPGRVRPDDRRRPRRGRGRRDGRALRPAVGSHSARSRRTSWSGTGRTPTSTPTPG